MTRNDSLRLVALVAGGHQALWNAHTAEELDFGEVGAPFPPREHLEFIAREGGEKLALVTPDDKVAGWIGLIPKTDALGAYSDLAGIGTPRAFRGRGIASRLIDAAQAWLAGRGIFRLEFGTSPLLVPNALLYFCRCGSSYLYGSSTLPVNGKDVPWPQVACSMPLPRSRNEYQFPDAETVHTRSVLTWEGIRPRLVRENLESSARVKFLLMPFMDAVQIGQDLEETGGQMLEVTDQAFSALTAQEYKFVGFGPVGQDYAYAFQSRRADD